MAVSTETRRQRVATTVGGGLAGGVLMGAVLQAGTGLMPVIGESVGVGTVLAGWAVHLTLSVIFAAGFVGLLALTPLTTEIYTAADTALLGMAYGGLLAMVTWGLVLPIAIASGAPFPLGESPTATGTLGLTIAVGLGHLSYGLALGTIVGLRHRPAPVLGEVVPRG